MMAVIKNTYKSLFKKTHTVLGIGLLVALGGITTEADASSEGSYFLNYAKDNPQLLGTNPPYKAIEGRPNFVLDLDGQEQNRDTEMFLDLLANTSAYLNPGTVDEKGEPLTSSSYGFLVVPHGRSLHHKKTSIEEPRHIGYVNRRQLKGETIATATQVYYGYVPSIDQLEVLSLNELTNEYEPFVVNNFKQGAAPKIEPGGNRCIRCHQNNNAPIIASAPWRETITWASNAGAEVNVESYNAERKKLKLPPIRNGMATYFFHNLVDHSNDSVQIARASQSMCEGDTLCKKTLLFYELARTKIKKFSDMSVENHKEARAFQEMLRPIDSITTRFLSSFWPDHNFSYPSQVLPDTQAGSTPSVMLTKRNQLAPLPEWFESELKGIEDFTYLPTVARSFGNSSPYRGDYIKIETITDWTAPRYLHPRLPRPLVSELNPNNFISIYNKPNLFFGLRVHELEIQNEFSLDNIFNIVFHSDEIESLVTTSWPPKRSQIIETMVTLNRTGKYSSKIDLKSFSNMAAASLENGSRKIPQIFAVFSKPAAIIDDNKLAELILGNTPSKEQALELTQNFCTSCHTDYGMQSSGSFQELPLEGPFSALAAWNKKHQLKASKMIRLGLMPDIDIKDENYPSERERAQMIWALENY